MRPRGRRPSPGAVSAGAGGVGSEGFSSDFFPVGMAVRRKIRSAQTMGGESQDPGTLTFHLTCSVSLQVTGGFSNGADPVASGPRHCRQNWVASEVALAALTIGTSKSAAML